MRFNPKARLNTSRVRDSGRSRGGGRTRGAARRGGAGSTPIRLPGGKAGSGIGGILLVLVVVVVSQLIGGGDGGTGGLGSTGLDSTRMADTGRYAGCESGADANESADCARVAVENSLVDYWSRTLPEQTGTSFRPAGSLHTFAGSVSTGCGAASSDVGPFYCPPDSSIYLDTTFFDAVLERQLGGPGGDFVEPYVLAHEYGHHIQNLLGAMGKVRTQQGPQSDAVRLELQADCYAGMWVGSATGTTDDVGEVLFTELTQQDISEALDAAAAVGDDRIQEKTQGQVTPETWTHGSAAARMRWFQVGYQGGSVAECDTFAVDRV